MKAAAPVFCPCRLHFINLLLKVIYFIWDLLLGKIWNCLYVPLFPFYLRTGSTKEE